jgi:toxin ParE1/3/4
MSTFKLTPDALLDLDDIWDNIAAEHPLNADRFLRQIIATLELIGSSPRMGLYQPKLGAGIRIHPVGKYLIIYRTVADDVNIIRIFHGSRRRTAQSIKKR